MAGGQQARLEVRACVHACQLVCRGCELLTCGLHRSPQASILFSSTPFPTHLGGGALERAHHAARGGTGQGLARGGTLGVLPLLRRALGAIVGLAGLGGQLLLGGAARERRVGGRVEA